MGLSYNGQNPKCRIYRCKIDYASSCSLVVKTVNEDPAAGTMLLFRWERLWLRIKLGFTKLGLAYRWGRMKGNYSGCAGRCHLLKSSDKWIKIRIKQNKVTFGNQILEDFSPVATVNPGGLLSNQIFVGILNFENSHTDTNFSQTR